MEQNETAATAEAVDTAAENTVENTVESTSEETNPAPEAAEPEAVEEEISYHAVEKDGHITAIWEMQGRRHLRTINPRSSEGKHIMSLFTSDHHEEAA